MGDLKDMEKECEHINYDVRECMDFTFCVCANCGFQWKGDKPYIKPEDNGVDFIMDTSFGGE